jgi:ribosomal protein L16 Arg81 hydroxylase
LKNDIEPPAQPTRGPAWEGIVADGDILYIPRGWWHEAFPLNEPSLHLTISLTPPTAMDYLAWAVSGLRRQEDMRASLPADDEAALAASTKTISGLLNGLLQQAPLGTFLQEWEANIRPNPHIKLSAASYEQFAGVTQESRIRLASLHRLSFTPHGENFEFFAAGRLWTVPKTLQPALANLHNGRELSLSDLTQALLDPSAKADLIKSLNVLAHAGVIVVRKAGPTP